MTQRRRLTQEFAAEAVRLALTSARTQREVAEDLERFRRGRITSKRGADHEATPAPCGLAQNDRRVYAAPEGAEELQFEVN